MFKNFAILARSLFVLALLANASGASPGVRYRSPRALCRRPLRGLFTR